VTLLFSTFRRDVDVLLDLANQLDDAGHMAEADLADAYFIKVSSKSGEK
jgi:hypothetical protein